jgi:hypothetical protein
VRFVERNWTKAKGQKGVIVAGKRTAPATQGFFDTYKDLSTGGAFMKKDEKDFLIQNGIAFDITGLQWEDPDEFNDNGRYVAFVTVPDAETGEPTERKISFPFGTNVPTRDSMLTAMKEYFDNAEGAEPVKVKLSQPGRAILIVNANS